MNNESNHEGLSRKEREKLQHRLAIIRAAVHLFARNGFNETKLEEVAALAEYGKGTIYNYFENKHDLLISSIGYVLENVLIHIREQLSGVEDNMERLRTIVIAQFDYYDENEDCMRLMISQHKAIVHEMIRVGDSKLHEKFRRLNNLLVEEFQQAIDAGRIKPGSAKHYTNYLSGMIHGQIKALSMGEIAKEEIHPEEIISIFFNGVVQ